MTAAKMQLRFHEIPASGLEFRFDQTTGELNEVLSDIMGQKPMYEANLEVRPVEKVVQLKGDIKGILQNTCARCAEEFTAPFEKKFLTAYYDSGKNVSDLGDAIDDIEGSFDVEFVERPEVNLADVVHEQVALEIPFRPLCSDDCKGLCAKCGTNLNMNSCSCEKEPVKIETLSPFAKLKNLKGD